MDDKKKQEEQPLVSADQDKKALITVRHFLYELTRIYYLFDRKHTLNQREYDNLKAQFIQEADLLLSLHAKLTPAGLQQLSQDEQNAIAQAIALKQRLPTLDEARRHLLIRALAQKKEENNRPMKFVALAIDDPDESQSTALQHAPAAQATIPSEISRALILAPDHQQQLAEYFEANPSQLSKQDEEGWTPCMQLAGQGHLKILEGYLQKIIARQYKQQQKLYAEGNVADQLLFGCYIFFNNYGEAEDADPKSKAKNAPIDPTYFVNSQRFGPFWCQTVAASSDEDRAELAKDAREIPQFLTGLEAYIFCKQLDIRARTYPNITVIDDTDSKRTFVATQAEHQAQLKQAIDGALSSPDCSGPLEVKPLRELIGRFLSSEFPQKKTIKPKLQKSSCSVQ